MHRRTNNRLSKKAFTQEIRRLRTRLIPLGRFVHEFANDIGQPDFFREENAAGFRYQKPDHRHYCLIRAARVVSAFNAAIALAESGFVQELHVLLRTAVEYCSQIDVVLLNYVESPTPDPKVEKYLTSFFADDRRIDGHRSISLGQELVHNALGARIDELIDKDKDGKPTSKMMSQSYLSLSYYVHGRYPESMDMYGGQHGHFHLNGMRNTPKDKEAVDILDTYVETASLCFVGIAIQLQLRRVLYSDPIITAWYRDFQMNGRTT